MRNRVRLHLLVGICLGVSLASASVRAAQNVEGTPQAKVYRASLKAVAAGDYEAYRKTLSSATLKQMDEQTKGKSPKEVMEFTKMMSPTDVKLISVKVEGKKATLAASATMDGQAMKGSIELEEEAGHWKVGQPNWQPAK